MITATGWTWEYIDDNMTLPRLEQLRGYWAKCPPVHVTVAAVFSGDEKSSSATNNIGDLLQAIPERK